MVRTVTAFVAFAMALLAGVGSVLAGQPAPMEIWHQTPGSQIAADIFWFDKYTLYFIVPITVLVMVLLLIVMVRFSKRANPVPSKTSHNSLIEVAWTVLPIVVLVFIALPSFKLLKDQLAPTEEPTMTVKATGNQWYWSYEYQDDAAISFDSLMLQEDERESTGKQDKAEYPRLLAVDNELIVPVGQMVRVLVTASDVLHSFAVPSLGFKIDAVPGRMNETWFKAEREGLYYGQCSELCGRDHAFMPIAIRVVSEDKYTAWKQAAGSDLQGAYRALTASAKIDGKLKLAAN